MNEKEKKWDVAMVASCETWCDDDDEKKSRVK